MNRITGTFTFTTDHPTFQDIQTAMKAIRQARRNIAKQGHEYSQITHQAGHSNPFPGIVNAGQWKGNPAKVEFTLVSSCTSNRRDIGKLTVYDQSNVSLPFEMDENLYNSSIKQLAKTGIATLTASQI